MKAGHILFALAAAFAATASPLGGSDANIYSDAKPNLSVPSRAPDPPPAPTPFPLSTDGQLPDGSIINYTPDAPRQPVPSCWTPPKTRRPPTSPYKHGNCSVCMVQRNGTDGSADYQLWARDQDNNAMGNMYATTVSPIDNQRPGVAINASMIMGGSPLLLRSEMFIPNVATVSLLWARPPMDPNDRRIWLDRDAGVLMFDPAAAAGVSNAGYTHTCNDAGSALDGAVRYAQCIFDCS